MYGAYMSIWVNYTVFFQWHTTGYTTWWVKNEYASIYDALLSAKSSFGLSEAADDVIWACNHRRCNYSWCLCEVSLTGLANTLHVTVKPPDHKDSLGTMLSAKEGMGGGADAYMKTELIFYLSWGWDKFYHLLLQRGLDAPPFAGSTQICISLHSVPLCKHHNVILLNLPA